MSDVPLLMSIRDQLTDTVHYLRDGMSPEIVTDENEVRRLWRGDWYPRSVTLDWDVSDEYPKGPPASIRHWPELKQLEVLMSRLDRYIEAAQKRSE